MRTKVSDMVAELASRRRERILAYADRAVAESAPARGSRSSSSPQAWRRAGLSAGLGLVLFGLAIALHGGPEVLCCMGAGGLLFGASIPAAGGKQSETE